MQSAGKGPTNPAAGVIVASPAMEPVAAPNIVGLPRWSHSTITHVTVADEAAIWVVRNAMVARVPDDKALPALNPNQPNHKSPAPSTVIGRLWGGICSCRKPFRFPM